MDTNPSGALVFISSTTRILGCKQNWLHNKCVAMESKKSLDAQGNEYRQ